MSTGTPVNDALQSQEHVRGCPDILAQKQYNASRRRHSFGSAISTLKCQQQWRDVSVSFINLVIVVECQQQSRKWENLMMAILQSQHAGQQNVLGYIFILEPASAPLQLPIQITTCAVIPCLLEVLVSWSKRDSLSALQSKLEAKLFMIMIMQDLPVPLLMHQQHMHDCRSCKHAC